MILDRLPLNIVLIFQFLSNDLLMIARAESGALRIVPRTLDIREVIESTLEKIQSLNGADTLSLSSEIAQSLPLISCDPDRIAQVLMILLDNAVNYGGETLQVNVRAERQGDAVLIRLSDNGRGIDADALPFIFDRYFRAADARSGQGSGLGLAIAKAIIDAHHGSINASSSPGEGTCFTIALPITGEHRG